MLLLPLVGAAASHLKVEAIATGLESCVLQSPFQLLCITLQKVHGFRLVNNHSSPNSAVRAEFEANLYLAKL